MALLSSKFSTFRFFAALQMVGLLPLAAADFSPDQLHSFETKVRPLLSEHCYSCHGPQKQNNGLRMDSRAAVLRGSDYGPVAEAGKAAESKLIKAINHAEGVEAMPKKAGKLPPEAIAVLTSWVQEGMPWPEETAPAAAVENWRMHWAFQPVALPAVPDVKAADRVRQPLDAHVLARLEQDGLTLAAEADRATLARRAYLDLMGLPPTFGQVQAFVSDPAPDALLRMVDGLLASPHFGERWARRWMDIARYADTKGYVFQEERRYAYAYTYRDWLISAFNNDLPYDRFLVLQLAADKAVDWEKQPGDLAAMGFLTLGRRFLNAEPDIIDDRLDVVFRGTQGLTVSCARCHDHKFDPIPTADYYSLYGVFASSTEPKDLPQIGRPDDTPELRAFQETIAKKKQEAAAFRGRFGADAKSPLPYLRLLSPWQEKRPFNRKHREKHRGMLGEIEKLQATNPAAPPRAMVMVDKPQAVEPVIFLRGNKDRHGPQVPRRFLKALAPGGERAAFSQGSGRLEMAQAIASPQNPLTARVWVNRVWTYLLGTPLVETPSDFGVRTPPPSNPALLDHLAAQFMADGWSTKKLVRSILLSSTWQQSSLTNPDGMARDPENQLFWRQNRRRLDFEALRDSLLFVSGNLDKTSGGRGQEMVVAAGPSRRTIYGLVDRQNLPGLFRTFDFASPDATAPKRFETTVPQQSLYLMNSPFVIAQAERLTTGPPTGAAADSIRQLYRTILSRDPDPDEIQLGLACLQDLGSTGRQTGTAWQNGWGDFDLSAVSTKFTPFTSYHENRWSPSATLPDAQLGYVNLTRDGGHPGNHAGQSAIRRWVASEPGRININGTVSLPSDKSTGITAFIFHSRYGLLGTWPVAPAGKAGTELSQIDLLPGDTLDFIVDFQGSPDSDSFAWSPVIRNATSNLTLADSAKDFGGAGASALAAYAQVLLCSNEFLFLD